MIKTISFLRGGKRVFLSPNSHGKFEIPGIRHSFTARQLVDHPNVKDNDPTLTLDNGKKYRVFYASNSNIPLVYPSVVIDDFDEMSQKKAEQPKVKIRKKVEERERQTTAPMAPIIPPFASSSAKTSANVSLPFTSYPKQDDEDDYDDYDVFGDYDW